MSANAAAEFSPYVAWSAFALAVVFGAVTSGNLWRFMKLQGTELSIDQSEYSMHQVDRILGILVTIVNAASGAA